MPMITAREDVLSIYREAADRGWALPCFCSENLTTTEAILSAAKEYADRVGIPDLPIMVAITVQYDHRSQACYYTHSRRWDLGLKLFMADLGVLTAPGSPYAGLRVLVHLDHIQFDDDATLLAWDLGPFSSIMFDASKVPFAENIERTAAFVRAHGQDIVIEGACDEIVDATGALRSDLTTADKAEEYFTKTGVDMIVANLGTEHRATVSTLHYYGENARAIRDRIGAKIVLHGASSVPADQIARLYNDGVCKVNLWTALERDTTPTLFADMVQNACKVAGPNTVARLKEQGLLGQAASAEGSNAISHFTTVYRQDIVYAEMKKMVESFLRMWYTV